MISNECSRWDIKVPYISYTASDATKERVVFGKPDNKLTYNYDDRLAEWDYKKWKSSRENAESRVGTPRYWQEILRKYFDDPGLELGGIITAVNQSSGYQYLVFGCKHSKKQA